MPDFQWWHCIVIGLFTVMVGCSIYLSVCPEPDPPHYKEPETNIDRHVAAALSDGRSTVFVSVNDWAEYFREHDCVKRNGDGSITVQGVSVFKTTEE